ncbi:uncharacterized protein [Fopius arisanus]|uniref:Uncharacterized protein n=1 Tax=Fopius arisanus TaxID=64838 RepID=A0A9R1TTR6_9HYME|nr:PREDICTED: uncharacterized protein LOC105273713 [Fopius arisanus]
MEDTKSENSVTMEQQVQQDSSSWGEWTIIHDDKEHNSQNPVAGFPEGKPKELDGDDDKERECHIDEEAREVIEEIDPTTLESSVASVTPREEDSDGISVITESDRGDSEIKGDITKYIDSEQTIPRFGLYTNFIAACCLAAAIGFGIGCVVGNGKPQLPSANVQVSLKPTLRRVEELNTDASGEISITTESESFDPTLNAPNIVNQEPTSHDILQHLTQENDQNLNIRKFEQIPAFRNSLQKLKLSLETLCSLIDQNQRVNYENVCSKNSRIFEVIKLKGTVEYIVNEFGYKEDASMKQFIESIDSKIETTVASFLDRLSKMVEKMRGRLFQRLCLIRNTYDNGAKIQEVLDGRLISLENCNSHKIPNPDKKRKTNKWKGRGIDSASGEIPGMESLKMEESAELPDVNKNKRRNHKSEEFRKSKCHISNEETLGDYSSEKNDIKKFKSSQGSKDDLNEWKDFYSSEQVKNLGKNHAKSKKKYQKQSKESNENSSEEKNFNTLDEQKENRGGYKKDFKPSKKYGTPKGEPKENFVEKKHGNNYDASDESNKGQGDSVCYSKKCSKPYDNDEKNHRRGSGKNGQWQFERAQGRRQYRSDEEDIYGVWYDNRAKARERARLSF